MMIASIIIKSGLVPLIKGLSAQIHYFRFEIMGGLRSHLFRFPFFKFFERKNILQQKSGPSKIGPSRCLIPTPGLTEYPLCAARVCVCVYTHLHPHTLPPALKIEKTPTTPLSFLLS